MTSHDRSRCWEQGSWFWRLTWKEICSRLNRTIFLKKKKKNLDYSLVKYIDSQEDSGPWHHSCVIVGIFPVQTTPHGDWQVICEVWLDLKTGLPQGLWRGCVGSQGEAACPEVRAFYSWDNLCSSVEWFGTPEVLPAVAVNVLLFPSWKGSLVWCEWSRLFFLRSSVSTGMALVSRLTR